MYSYYIISSVSFSVENADLDNL